MEGYKQISNQQGVTDRSHKTSPDVSSTNLLLLTYHLFTEREYHFKPVTEMYFSSRPGVLDARTFGLKPSQILYLFIDIISFFGTLSIV
jgi:hypothetical protein